MIVLDLRTVEDFKKILKAAKHFNDDKVSLDSYEALLRKAEALHEENQALYDKLNNVRIIVNESI